MSKKVTAPQISDVQRTACARALNLLAAAKVQFAVIDHDGNLHGSLPVRQRASSVGPRNNFSEMFPDYADKIRSMAVGDVVSWDVNAGLSDPFRKCVASVGAQAHGKKSCITEVGKDGTAVQILRVE